MYCNNGRRNQSEGKGYRTYLYETSDAATASGKRLRVISAAMKMVSDMERIGDQACDITGIVKKDAEVLTIRENTHLDKMAKATTVW